MELATWLAEMVQTVGFPIVICGYLLYERRKIDIEHKEEMKNMTEALNNNTVALTKIHECLKMEDSTNE